MNKFQALLTNPKLDHDIELQLVGLELLFGVHPAARGEMLDILSKRLPCACQAFQHIWARIWEPRNSIE